MPTIARFNGLKICIFPGDHAPPHFHVMYQGTAFQVRLDNLQVLAGRANRRAFALAVEWAARNGQLLSNRWDEING